MNEGVSKTNTPVEKKEKVLRPCVDRRRFDVYAVYEYGARFVESKKELAAAEQSKLNYKICIDLVGASNFHSRLYKSWAPVGKCY